MYSLNSFSLSRLNNAEITAFFINVQKAITEATASALGLANALVTNYTDTLKKLVDQVYISQGNPLTATMNAADQKRTQIVKRIRLRLQMVEVADDNAALQACRETVETHLLSKYTADVSRMPIQQKSAVIQGFINDLQGKLSEDDIEALGIESDISALTVANNEFIAAYNQRSAERANAEGEVTKKLRAQMGEYYQIIGLSVQLSANDDSAEGAEKAKACQDFVGIVNVYLADAKKRYLQRTGKLPDDDNTSADTDASSSDSNNASASTYGNSSSGSGSSSSASDSSSGSSSSSSGSSSSGSSSIPGVSDDVVFPGV